MIDTFIQRLFIGIIIEEEFSYFLSAEFFPAMAVAGIVSGEVYFTSGLSGEFQCRSRNLDQVKLNAKIK